MQYAPKFQEEYSAKLPALTLLSNLGWQFLSPQQALAARGNNNRQAVLTQLLRETLSQRTFTFAGKRHHLSEKNIDKLVREFSNPALGEGLRKANETLYHHLLYGIAVTEFVDGRKTSPTIPLIDWHTPENNSFVFTEEFTLACTGSTGNRRPDIVCFVNGIPWVVIEAKRPDSKSSKGPTLKEGISQSLRNQRPDEIPQLFACCQLILSINGQDGRYGTCGTPEKFFASWREEDIDEQQMLAVKNSPLSTAQLSSLFDHRKPADRGWYESLCKGGDLALTGQDVLLISLLKPARLLEVVRYFTLFESNAGRIVARYQQVFGIKRLIERIGTRRNGGGREGGIIWHTTGSGKSFTMVFLSRALILHHNLKNCRIVVVTDRVDLETQLSNTFKSSGELAGKREKVAAMATSGKRLAEQIGQGTERIIFSLIQKFNSATQYPQCHNASEDIIVLVDEGHRSQNGENHTRMTMALPNAAFIAFTGTPLLKKDKTAQKFGAIIHACTMQRAVDDKAVTPLLYEERKPDLDVNSRAIDAWFERITDGLEEKQKSDLKQKFSQKGQVYSAEDRIRLIALDVAHHFDRNIDDGLTGQLACDSKASAILYKQFLDEAGLFESAVVISAPDTREGNSAIDESAAPEVTRWWQQNVGSQDESSYTRDMIQRFGDPDDPLRLLIVVDKLLTGFDEPSNTVLYIDKPLKEHNLIQAVARVNRLHDKKQFGLLIDYRGVLSELDTTLQRYQDLAARTQGGYDADDLDGLYGQMRTEYKRLPALYNELWAIFDSVSNRNDIEQLRRVLVPRMEEHNGEMVDVNQKLRDQFYTALRRFAACLKVALQSASFFTDPKFTEADRKHHKETLKQLTSLRQMIRQDAGEAVDYDQYADEIKKLLDRHVVGVEVKEPKGVYDVSKLGQQENDNPEDWDEDKTRNETDTIRTRTTRMIEQSLEDDPYAKKKFSELLKETIEEAEKLFEHPLKQYLLWTEFSEKVETRRLAEIPDRFKGKQRAQACYGVFKLYLPGVFAVQDVQVIDKWVGLAFEVDEVITAAIAENSINPEGVEASMRKVLLPKLLGECRKLGAGLDQAKKMVEKLVQLVREKQG